MYKYRLIDYFDVWGNEQDGYDVNNLACILTGITITNDSTEKDIKKWLSSL